jgi:hypothetical protein
MERARYDANIKKFVKTSLLDKMFPSYGAPNICGSHLNLHVGRGRETKKSTVYKNSVSRK